MTTKLSPELTTKVLAATDGTKFGAIIRCALGVDRDVYPRFEGKAHVTSDGYVMCDFVGQDHGYHTGAFVGALSDLDLNIVGLSKHLGMTPSEYNALTAIVTSWIGRDWRR
mgnify:CR=1 FL=1